MSNDIQAFKQAVNKNIEEMGKAEDLRDMGIEFVRRAGLFGYSYNFNWMGVPIIQFPQDIVAMQELIWQIKPDVIVETGVARGGSLIFYASMLELIGKPDAKVIGVDIDIRAHNREVIESHPMSRRIQLIQGSSVDEDTFNKVKTACGDAKSVLVCLDSMHTHQHVLDELRLYSKLVTPDSYLVAFDTCIEEMPADYYPDRPWKPGNNPMTAVKEFLKEDGSFVEDRSIPDKLLITVARSGYLRKVK